MLEVGKVLIKQAVADLLPDQLSDYVNATKEELNLKNTVISNIENAKKDLKGYLTNAINNVEALAEHLGGDGEGLLNQVSDFIKEGKDVREKTMALLGSLKNAKKEFWLALIQLLVDAAQSSLAKQQSIINSMVDTARTADAPSSLKNANVSYDALLYAYKQVVISRGSLEEARSKLASGDTVIKTLTNKAIANLKVAEQRLARELVGIKGLGDIKKAISSITAAQIKFATYSADYIVQYIATLLFVQGIYYIEQNVLKTKQVIDIEEADKILKSIIKIIRRDTETPMENTKERWEKKQASQLSLIRDATKYSSTIRNHWEKISVYFGDNYVTLSGLSINSQKYNRLLTGLQSNAYLNADRKTAGSDIKDIATRLGMPSMNVFSMKKGSTNDYIFKSMRTKYIKELKSVLYDISEGSSVLGRFGSYKSELLKFISKGLSALGYGKSPMLDFAMGKLIKTSNLVEGIPSVRSFMSAGSIQLVGLAISGNFQEAVQAGVTALASRRNAAKVITEGRKEARNIENVMDKQIEQMKKEAEALEDEIKIIDAGAKGEVPDEFIEGLLPDARY